jgi:hypothetical protein
MPTYQVVLLGMGDAVTWWSSTDFGRWATDLLRKPRPCSRPPWREEEIHAAVLGYWRYTGERMDTRANRDRGTVAPCDQDAAIREYAFETQTFVVSANLIQPPESVPDSFPYKSRSHFSSAVGGSAIVNPFGMYLVEPVIGKETIVYADLRLEDRIVAKNIFDCMGHYARWDVVSFNLLRRLVADASAVESRRIASIAQRSLRSTADRDHRRADFRLIPSGGATKSLVIRSPNLVRRTQCRSFASTFRRLPRTSLELKRRVE